MSTTGLDAATLARSLRRMAGDGSVEWVMEPIQSSVLRDIADMLDENKKLREQIDAAHMSRLLTENENESLRELVRDMYRCSDPCNDCPHYNGSNSGFYCGLGIGWKARRMRDLGVEVPR